jgi:hypothetical protein
MTWNNLADEQADPASTPEPCFHAPRQAAPIPVHVVYCDVNGTAYCKSLEDAACIVVFERCTHCDHRKTPTRKTIVRDVHWCTIRNAFTIDEVVNEMPSERLEFRFAMGCAGVDVGLGH